MIENNRNNEQIYGRNDMIMLDQNNKIYGSLGIADRYVMKTEEGTRLILSNPKLGKFGDVLTEFNIYGRSEQKQYKGINLFPPNTKRGDFVEVSIPKGTKVFAITDGTKFNGGNFRFFNADKTENMWFGVEKDTTMSIYELKIDAKYVQNLLESGLDFSKICLGIGNEPIYEPYTGGIPSPSPDYPQEIKSVVNPTVKVCGKNLWDNFKTLSLGNVEQKNGTYIATADTMQVDITSSSIGARPLLLKANNAYTFSLKTTVSISSPKFVCLRYTNGEINNIIFINKNFVNFVPERDVEKIGFILYESVAGDKAYDVQLEIGSEATSYEPYHEEQTVTLPYTLNAIPVSSGGNYTDQIGQQWICDEVDLHRGVKVQRIYEVDVDGENVKFEQVGGYANILLRGLPIPRYAYAERIYGISTFTSLPWFFNEVSGQFLYLIESDISNKINESCKKKMGKIYYVLGTPIETPLTSDEIAAFNAITAYYPVTIVENNYNTWMKATYKSTESV